MFGKTKKPNKPKKQIQVNAIPEEFYGGADPVVKFKEVEREIEIAKPQTELTASERKSLEMKTTAGAGKKIHPANLLTNTKFLVFSVLGLFILFIGVASVYYFIQSKPKVEPVPVVTPKPAITVPPPVEQPEEPIVIIEEPIIPTTTPAEEEPEPLEQKFIEFPSVLLGLGSDLDGDGVSDMSEEVFKIDSGIVDTDDDTYTDSHELYYLYNPAGFQPMRLVDSGLVKEFRNPIFGFRIYYPNDWVIGNIDQTYRQSLVSAPNGEYIEIHTVDLENDQSFVNWFGKNATGQKLSDLEEFTTRFEEVGLYRKDGLVYYFQDDRRRLYIVMYKATDKNTVNYKTVLEVMARSFRLFNNTIAIPIQNNEEGVILEEIDDSTTSTEIIDNTTSAEEAPEVPEDQGVVVDI